jgi:glyoxylase-like metal-dependent hydrolase (beta-lactamase superfamily II)
MGQKMPAGTYEFNVGAIRCIVLQEFILTAEVSVLTTTLPNASSDDIKAALNKIGHTSDQIQGSMSPLYIETDGIRILVDTGFGENGGPGTGNVVSLLQTYGITPQDINIVYLSHLHGDHINGLTKKDGSPTYPNARCMTSQAEWDYWMSAETLAAIGEEHAEALNKILLPHKNKFRFVNADEEIAPGVCVVDAPGHTPGHSGLLVESEGERLLVLVDALHVAIQFVNPAWHHRVDVDPDTSTQTRRMMLQRAADENMRVLFYHLKFPGLGRIVADNGEFQWHPIFDSL